MVSNEASNLSEKMDKFIFFGGGLIAALEKSQLVDFIILKKFGDNTDGERTIGETT